MSEIFQSDDRLRTNELSEEKWVRRRATGHDTLQSVRSLARTPACHQLLDVYEGLIAQADGARALKADFEPMALRRHTANAVLYDVSDPDHVRFRVVGERIKEHFHINPVGLCYLDFVPEERRAHAHGAFRHCAETPCGMLVRTRQIFASGLSYYCEALGMPLFGHEPETTATHLIFVDSPIDSEARYRPDEAPLRYSHLLDRHFVDLGNGAPSDFEDLVLADEDSPFRPSEEDRAGI